MKVIGICGSPKKKNSTTLFALNRALEACRAEGVEAELLELSRYSIQGCNDCDVCREKPSCPIKDDFSGTIAGLLGDGGIKGFIFASPVYFGGVTSLMKAFFDRSVLFRRNGFAFEHRIAAALTVGRSRHGGQELAALDIVKYCLIQGMIVVPDGSPSSHFGANLWSGGPDGIEHDTTGLEMAAGTGRNVAKLVKLMYGRPQAT